MLHKPQLPTPWSAMVSLKSLMDKPGATGLASLKMSLRKFAAIPDQCQALFTSLHDCEIQPPDGGNTEKDVSVYPVGGRSKITPARFSALDSEASPQFTVALADVQSAHAGRKRQRKAVDRTLAFLDSVRAEANDPTRRLFGAIVGGADVECRARSAQETAFRPLAGFFIEGIDHGLTRMSRSTILDAVIPLLPDDKPRGVRCTGHPVEVLELIASGADLFDCAYPVMAAERGEALMFTFGGGGGDSGVHGLTKNSPSADVAAELHTALSICLWDSAFAADFTRLDSDTPYTRGYVHHLLLTHEMLATVALTAHNIAHYLAFFESIRQSIRRGDFDAHRADFLARYTAPAAQPH
jgi:queuine tRNA-ribosyltransferase subunit QTRTD1